jgi:rhodanese-related sulfurtransferase
LRDAIWCRLEEPKVAAVLAQWLLLAALALAGTACAPHISRSELANRIATGSAPPILDVRTAGEYDEAHVPGAIHIPFYSTFSRRGELPTAAGEPLVVYCEHGPRAGLARVGLWLAGAGEVRFLEGHMTAWKADDLPVERVDGSARASGP